MRRLTAKLRQTMPWLTPQDGPACRAWAELEVLASRAFQELERNGLCNGQGEARRLLGDYRALRRVQLLYEHALGMTPSARRQLGLDANAKEVPLAEYLAAKAKDSPTTLPAEPAPPTVARGSQKESAGVTFHPRAIKEAPRAPAPPKRPRPAPAKPDARRQSPTRRPEVLSREAEKRDRELANRLTEEREANLREAHAYRAERRRFPEW